VQQLLNGKVCVRMVSGYPSLTDMSAFLISQHNRHRRSAQLAHPTAPIPAHVAAVDYIARSMDALLSEPWIVATGFAIQAKPAPAMATACPPATPNVATIHAILAITVGAATPAYRTAQLIVVAADPAPPVISAHAMDNIAFPKPPLIAAPTFAGQALGAAAAISA
jgi:hypothetical protein